MSERPNQRDGGGRVVLVTTPIGNLDDLSPRAARALAEADLVAAEDTRRSGRLLAHLGLHRPLISYHEYNERERAPALLDRVARGETIAVVTDAGTPAIADPGYEIVRAAIARGLPVEAVPGPSAVLHALVLSGLPTDRFAFEGFLPRRAGPRRRRLEELAADARTLVFYLAPHRAGTELTEMAEVFGARPAALARELTKLHEEVWRGPLDELAARAASERVRGELTLVVAGAPPPVATDLADAELARRVAALTAAGTAKKPAIAEVAARAGVSRRRVYQAVLDHG